MSTLPSVISRFVDYYATLDTQPPSALAGIYRADATLIDPFGEHSGVFAIQRYFTHLLANVQHCRFTVDAPLQQGDRFVVTWMMHWSHPRIAGGNAPAAGLLRGRHARRSHCSPAGLLRCRRDDLRTSPDTRLGRARREAKSEIMKTVLITGASSGIGAGLAKSFADDGYRVIACGRDAQRLAAVHQHSPNITVRLFDMTDRDACRQALADCTADTVILCAGTCEYLDRGEVDAELVARVMTTNFIGPVNCLAALQPQLVSGNRVVLVSSMAHWLHFPRAEAYGASKAALTWFADTLRLDWEPKGIAVTVVSPGFVDTPLTRKNDFPMPGRVSVGDAVHAIRRGLAKGKDHIAFPAGFSLALRLLSGLPDVLQRALLRRMVRP